jgi:hypothetical protein
MDDIIYMNGLSDWKIKYNRGLPLEESEILLIESKYNISFPKAYKEFLELSGVYCVPIKVGKYQFEYMEEYQKRAKELLKQYNVSHLIQKDFWVIGDTDLSFYYIHFDEGDNPPVYRLTPEDYEEYPDESSFGKIADTFEAWVNKWIVGFESEQALGGGS